MTQHTENKKVLLVEDSLDMRLIYKRLFRRAEDIEIAESSSAEEALHAIPEINPDLLIVDISLPGISGLELTRRVRRLYPQIKILVVTGHELDWYHEEAIRSGADALISKSIGSGLVEKCREMLQIDKGI